MKTPGASPPDEPVLLSSLPPGRGQERLAAGIVVAFVCAYVAISVGPLSKVAPARLDAFIPIYATATIACDSITAVLLFAQFSILRTRAILAIASGYLYAAGLLTFWFLAFPGAFGAGSLIGGLQSSVWLHTAWRFGFPLFVLVYALTKDAAPGPESWQRWTHAAIGRSVGLTVALVAIIVLVCTAGEPSLPRLMLDAARLGPLWPAVGAVLGLVNIGALVVLWRRRQSMLDLWLLVVMCLFVIEIPLSYYPTPIRFSLAFYTVRILGIVSSGVVLVALLYEVETLYARLLGAVLAQRRERQARLVTGDAVAATVAHEVRQPLTAMVTSADAGLRFLERQTPDLDRAKGAFRRISADGHRASEVVGGIRAMFKLEVRPMHPLDLNELIHDVLALQREHLAAHRILVRAEPAPQVTQVDGDRIQLQQVLLNLITNAVESMAADDGPRLLCVRSEPHPPGSVLVSVSDTGAGVIAGEGERIFNPLFTTKPDGMGMGLAICRSIIEAHDGRLWTLPNAPRGAIFHFTLQASPKTIVQ